MLDAGRKVIFLTGAPLSSSLRWTEEELCAPPQPGFVERKPFNWTEKPSTDDKAPSWRSLPLEKPHLPTGLTQISQEDLLFEDLGFPTDGTAFFSPTEFSFISDTSECPSEQSRVSDSANGDLYTQYYEQSFAIHENIPSSQIVGAESLDESFITEPEDFPAVFSTSSSQPHPAGQLARSRLTSSSLSELKDMPNAAYLRSITPQTMTVNLVVGIISISPPRTIKTRKGARSIELVEMLVGDGTKAGFGINIWLPPPPPSENNNHHLPLVDDDDGDILRNQTMALRSQDVVLARNVALSSFRDKVYGQSLRRGMTTLDLLYRNALDGHDDAPGAYGAAELERGGGGGGEAQQVQRVRDVKEWVFQFVGGNTGALPGGTAAKPRRANENQMQALPDDTPQK